MGDNNDFVRVSFSKLPLLCIQRLEVFAESLGAMQLVLIALHAAIKVSFHHSEHICRLRQIPMAFDFGKDLSSHVTVARQILHVITLRVLI